MKKRKNKKYRIIPFMLILTILLIGSFIVDTKSGAEIPRSDEAGSPSDIGTYEDWTGGYSHVGVKVDWEDELECFALDTYQKLESGYWPYVISNVNGEIQRVNYGLIDSYSPIHMFYINDNNFRFKLRNSMITKGREDYSIILKCYLKGELLFSQYHITGVPNGEHGCNMESKYCLSNDYTLLSSHDAVSRSYIYKVYDPRIIEPDGDELSLDTCGGKFESAGKAYVSEEGLRLVKLPVVSMKKTGHDCVFAGWYSAATGGKKYQVGDILQKGDVLYARWSITPSKYDVTCIDIRGDNPSGVVLGQKTWTAVYDTEVSAASAGTDKNVGAYYPNCYYKTATTARVTTEGATVYRYFSYESYPVEYIDQIKEGTRANEILNKVKESREYASTAKGSDIGLDHTPGAYYEGYYYDTCTSMIVKEQGTVVYRFFKPVKYTIELDGNGGLDNAMTTTYECEYDKEVTLRKNRFYKNSTVTLYQSLEKKPEETTEMTVKHNFLGWSVEKNGPVRYADCETLKNITNQNEKIILYAVWSEESVSLPTLSAPIGYRFLGWAKDSTSKTGMTQMNISDATELYAVWEKEIVKYHVEYYKENLSGEYEIASNYEFDGYVDEEVSLDSLDDIYQGFTLDKASSKLTGTIKPDGSLILCAYYRRNAYSFMYDLNGGSLQNGDELQKENVKFGTNLKLTSVLPQKEGYIFQGWCQEADDTHTLFQPRDSYVMQNHDVIMHAQWKQLAFKIKYDNNGEFAKITGITGSVPETDYAYQKDSYASSTVYQSEYGEVVSWNTKPDGNGISILPGTNIKGLFDTYSEVTLYAIWKYKISDTDVAFQVKLCQEKDGQQKVLDTLTLYGKAGEKISTAILRLYQSELHGESVIYFYRGFEIVNVQELEQPIALDASTDICLLVKERDYQVSFQFGEGEEEKGITDIIGKYQNTYTLPDSLSDGLKVERYEDNLGNYYFPGDTITLDRNLKLMVQQAIHLFDASGKDTVEYITRGKDYTLPERKKNGYRFLGWYNSLGEFIGKPGQVMKKITKRCDYYERWSDPLTYSITYDLGTSGIQILENKVSYHQYTKDTILPNKTQIVVPDGYQFDGWYDSADAKKTLITKISATDYGDKILCPMISKISTTDNKKEEHTTENNKNTTEDKTNTNSDDKTNTNSNDKTDDSINHKEDSGDQTNQAGGEKDSNNNTNHVENESNNGNNQTGEASNPGTNGNSSTDDISIGQNTELNINGASGIKKQPNEVEELSVGDVFWKGNLKYKIISNKKGIKRVKVIAGKKNLSKISIPSKVTYRKIQYKVTVIGKKAFYKAKRLIRAVIGNNVMQIEGNAFANAKKLKQITIGSGVKKIEAGAFEKDRQLKNIVIKSRKISRIGKKAFYQMHAKGKIQVPKSKKKTYRKLLKASKLKKTNKIYSK